MRPLGILPLYVLLLFLRERSRGSARASMEPRVQALTGRSVRRLDVSGAWTLGFGGVFGCCIQMRSLEGES